MGTRYKREIGQTMRCSAIVFLLGFLLLWPPPLHSQGRGRTVPPFLVKEVDRLSRQCYFFEEFGTFWQRNRRYVLVVFLGRDAVRPAWGRKIEPRPECGARPPQVRLYQMVGTTSVRFCDSVLTDTYRVSLGAASPFSGSDLTNVLINHACRVPQGVLPPLLCYAMSAYEITAAAKFRYLLNIGDVPERWAGDRPLGRSLEPVATDNLDGTPEPELLAIDDFFEGDPAFRSDDFPKTTLIYAWDRKERVFRNASPQYPYRFSAPSEITALEPEAKLVTIVEKVMALAMVGRAADAEKFMEMNLIPERFARWRGESPDRAEGLDADRLRTKLARCIARYR